jgi:hypothetical protein
VTVNAVPVLHVPDEPTARAEAWRAAIRDGREFEDVLSADDGVTAWLWSRWRSLAAAGLDEEALSQVVLGYKRELWLWLAGERTWVQCCSGLIGRVNRRIPPAAATGV